MDITLSTMSFNLALSTKLSQHNVMFIGAFFTLMLSVTFFVMLRVIILNVVKLSVVAPSAWLYCQHFTLRFKGRFLWQTFRQKRRRQQ